jgi:hypothetical protein
VITQFCNLIIRRLPARFGSPYSQAPVLPLRNVPFTLTVQRGWSIEEVSNKLLEVSAKAQERARLRDEGYSRLKRISDGENHVPPSAIVRARGRGLFQQHL